MLPPGQSLCHHICELQPVEILNSMNSASEALHQNPDKQSILDKVKLSSAVTQKEEERCKDLITEFSDVFSINSTDIGTTHKVKHRIEMHDTRPFKQKYRRIPPAMIEEVRTHIQELLANGVIRTSHSPFSSNVDLVR